MAVRRRPALVAALILALAAGACASSGGGREDDAGAPSPGRPASESVEWAGLRYEVSILPSPSDRIRLRAEVTNVSGGFRRAEMPWCMIQARLHRDGAVVYDQAKAEGCGDALRTIRLESSESETFHRTLTAARVLGDSIEPGRFEVSARLPGATGPGLPRARMELRLGAVTLERPQAPRPDSPATTAAGVRPPVSPRFRRPPRAVPVRGPAPPTPGTSRRPSP